MIPTQKQPGGHLHPDGALKDVTTLAAQICHTPIARVCMNDNRRQWITVDNDLRFHPPEEQDPFDAYTRQNLGIHVVSDAMEDSRFAQNIWVTGEAGIRFYAGIAIFAPTGAILGVICVMDQVPRSLSAVQEHTLQMLGRHASALFELQRQKDELARQENELKQSEDRLRSFMAYNPAAVWIVDEAGVLRYANTTFCRLFGQGKLDLTGVAISDLYEPAFAEEYLAGNRIVFEQQRVLQRIDPARRPDGSVASFLTVKFPLHEGNTPLVGGMAIDVTDRYEMENALRASESRFAAIFRTSPSPIGITILATGEVIELNERMSEFFGWRREEAIGKSVHELRLWVHGEQRARLIEEVTLSGSVREAEVQLRVRSGEIRDVLISLERVDVPGDARPMMVTMLTDITERKIADARFRRLFESNVHGVFYWNSRGAVTEANDAYLRIIGYDRNDLLNGRINWVAITPIEYGDADERSLAEIAAHGSCKSYEKEYIRKDGTRVPILMGAAMLDEDPDQGVSFVVDLTEAKRMEHQFLRAQRMESVGTLAGGIAHDLNNALSPILMSLPLLKTRVTDESSHNLLTLIETSARRGADMVNQVLSYARGVSGQRLPILISDVLMEIQRIVESTFPKSIVVRAEGNASPWTVWGDPTQIHQLLLNICVNARDAMPQGGTLTITSETIHIDTQYTSLDPEAKEGPYVLVKIADTGMGIKEDVLTYIFDPFFTTKEVGKGTGLGLSTSQSIAKSHGGFIRVTSEFGKGTAFSIYFPAQLHGPGEAHPSAAADAPRGNGELILIVEDENIMREVTQQTLESYGYRVLAAPGGTEAAEMFSDRGSEVAAVLTDVSMPLIDGPTTIHILRRMNARLPIVVASGRYTDAHLAKLDALNIQYRLTKPFTAEALLRMLKQALNS